MEIANAIDLHVKHWRETLFEVAGISGGEVLNSCGEMEITDAIEQHVKHWREAFCEDADISEGVYYFDDIREAIQNIVKNLTSLLDKTELFVANNPVGVEFRVQEMVQMLDQKQPNDVLLLGVWGMGGIEWNTCLGRAKSCNCRYDKNKLGMHDLLRDMGREVIRSKSPMELEERSRLWFHEDVLDVLSKETILDGFVGMDFLLPSYHQAFIKEV
ncbi:unnamed protein product [Sphenostylis stenocarpa]|uniref:Uncharacterized protein n=1 Tax=Sphenostylis stenocarpa TaxID=92480 RepID=A0AA86SA08_9FABA|nr:unnamed protein product [Sphenostylis stenocarpa]